MAHIRASEACGVVQRGAPSINVATGFVAHLEVVLHPMLIMLLLILGIGSIQYVMNLLANVLNALNEFVRLRNFRLDMS